jgi:hypothetical protein
MVWAQAAWAQEAAMPLTIQAMGRTAFVRMEKDAVTAVVLGNVGAVGLGAGQVKIRCADQEKTFVLPALAPQESHRVQWSVDTSLRPAAYAVHVVAFGEGYRSETSLEIVVVKRPLPHRMPVLMWGGGDLDRLTEIGFTHHLRYLANYRKIWDAGEPTLAAAGEDLIKKQRSLDEHLVRGVGAAVYLYPGRWVARDSTLYEKYRRVDRQGQPYNEHNVCASFEALGRYSFDVGASIARTFGDYPALQASLVHSEIRDATDLCFHDHDHDAYRVFSGAQVPPEAERKGGVRYTALKDFPRDRVVSDDHPLLRYYRWFWKEGDGWNGLHTRVHEGLKSTGRDDLWTFFDPAVRVPSVWGSGGAVDYASHWTYSYPDPLKLGQVSDALFAMAAGRPGQQVMKMTQIIWYRSQTAPELPEADEDRAEWEKTQPEARFITAAPDHLREAFWAKISRPIRGIMYHGWGSLVEVGDNSGTYRYTHPQTQKVLAELVRTVVRPLGPTLLQVPDRPADVALLESFASQVFAGRGGSGWGRGWESDAHLVLQWAQLQPKIVYDETLRRDGLDGVRVLVLPNVDVLTEEVARRINRFQERGGLVVADERVAPAILPDMLLPSYRRTGDPKKDKAALQARAAALRGELDDFYGRYADSSDPDVVLRARRYDKADYLFAVNDKRTFGDYIGHHRMVMEKGLAASADLHLARGAGHVYDLVRHQEVLVQRDGDGLRFKAELGPGGGRVYMVTDQALDGVRLKAPKRVRRGRSLAVEVRVVDGRGKNIAAVVPVRLEVLDPAGRPAERSGYYGARDGRLAVELDIAANDAAGQWTLRLTELASGRSVEKKLTVH